MDTEQLFATAVDESFINYDEDDGEFVKTRDLFNDS
jgi:hypothetical protein